MHRQRLAIIPRALVAGLLAATVWVSGASATRARLAARRILGFMRAASSEHVRDAGAEGRRADDDAARRVADGLLVLDAQAEGLAEKTSEDIMASAIKEKMWDPAYAIYERRFR